MASELSRSTNVSSRSQPVKGLQDRLEERRTKEIQKLSTLLQISQALSGTLDLRAALHEVLETLGRHHALRSFVVLANKETRELSVEASAGTGRPPSSLQAG